MALLLMMEQYSYAVFLFLQIGIYGRNVKKPRQPGQPRERGHCVCH